MSELTLIPVYKPIGVTSTDIVNQYKRRLGVAKLMHSGALDPMAEGLLLLVNGTTTPRDILQFTGFDKTYEFQFVLGVTTDTWDVLGLVQSVGLPHHVERITERQILDLEGCFIGEITQTVPMFSNMRFRNKRMYQWAREGKGYLVLEFKRKRYVSDFKFNNYDHIGRGELYNHAKGKVSMVQGDFRQTDIVNQWTQFDQWLGRYGDVSFPLVTATIRAESGTYVRSIVHDIGTILGIGAITWHILRTSVGPYTLADISE